MSTPESWELTPREFRAKVNVYERWLERYGQERADFRNAHFKKEDGGHWALWDFVHTPSTLLQKQRAEADRLALAAAKRAEARQLREMRKKDFDDSSLPSWARMTPEEKAKVA